jgi:hypothetical protein
VRTVPSPKENTGTGTGGGHRALSTSPKPIFNRERGSYFGRRSISGEDGRNPKLPRHPLLQAETIISNVPIFRGAQGTATVLGLRRSAIRRMHDEFCASHLA